METNHPPRKNNEGVALMLVLLLIVLLTTIVFEYAYETQVEASLSYNGKADMEAYIAAKSAIAIGMSMLQADQMQDTGMDQYGNAMNQVQQIGQNQQGQNGEAFGEYDCKWTDAWGQPVVQPINGATLQCNIEDECGKLNLNMFCEVSAERQYVNNGNGATDGQSTDQQATETAAAAAAEATADNPEMQQQLEALETALRSLFDQMEVENNPTDAILDWLDVDDDVRPEGAESDYYESLETPYACKNGPMESIEELLLIAGITPEMYFDLNRDPDETQQLREENDPLYPVSSLPDLLTCCGSIQGKINVNNARRELLMALFNDEPSVETIMEAQQQAPYQDVQDLSSSAPLPEGLGNLLDVKSNVFRIQGDGYLDDVMVRVEAYVVRPDPYSEVPMPFRILSWRVIR